MSPQRGLFSTPPQEITLAIPLKLLLTVGEDRKEFERHIEIRKVDKAAGACQHLLLEVQVMRPLPSPRQVQSTIIHPW